MNCMIQRLLFGAFFFLTLIPTLTPPLQAAYLFTNGHFINLKDQATMSVEEHFEKGLSAFKKGDWDQVITQMRIVSVNFPTHSLGIEAIYYLGVAYYQLGDLDIANKTFNAYLKDDQSKDHFEDLYRYKLSIAEQFANGTRRHLFSLSVLPKWQTGHGIALELFDEINNAMPNHELAAVALLEKGKLLSSRSEFQDAEKTLQQVIKKFPLSNFSKQAFQQLAIVLKTQSEKEPQNIDIIDLAEINKREFERSFGTDDPSFADMQSSLTLMKEERASSLYETGQLYERMKDPKAAVLYYALVLDTLQGTIVYTKCQERMKDLKSYAEELHLHIPL